MAVYYAWVACGSVLDLDLDSNESGHVTCLHGALWRMRLIDVDCCRHSSSQPQYSGAGVCQRAHSGDRRVNDEDQWRWERSVWPPDLISYHLSSCLGVCVSVGELELSEWSGDDIICEPTLFYLTTVACGKWSFSASRLRENETGARHSGKIIWLISAVEGLF